MPKYNGTITTTGRSEAIRLDKDLFKQHPEFQQKSRLQAHVIAPGQMLISLLDTAQDFEVDEDPVVTAFLCFMEQDMLQHPEHILPLSEDLLHQVSVITQEVEVSDDEILPDEVSF